MRVSASFYGLNGMLEAEFSSFMTDTTEAMKVATDFLKNDLRDQVTRAGLGVRLGKTWRGQTYPNKDDVRRGPAGFVYSNAPDIISAYATGATLVPLAGRRFLAIPTKNVPRSGGRGFTKRMNPFEVEHAFNQDLVLRKGKRGTILGFVNAVAARSRKRPGLREATKGRVAQGRAVRLVLMFIFVKSVRVARVLDLQGAANRAADVFTAALER